MLLLCVGIMFYLLLCYWKIGFGSWVVVVGLGGFGYMGLKFVRVFGVEVVLFICLLGKEEEVWWFGVD